MQFVETNVIIGETVDWDRQSSTIAAYHDRLAGQVDRWTSVRVLAEATDVVRARRRASRQAARLVFEEFEPAEREFASSRPPVDQLAGFLRGTLGGRDAVVDHVIQYVRSRPALFVGLTQTDSERALQRTIEDVGEDFDAAIDVIESIRTGGTDITVFTDVPRSYESHDDYDAVAAVLGESPVDRAILFDADRLARESEETVTLVTMDGDLLDPTDRLSEILGTVVIAHPDGL